MNKADIFTTSQLIPFRFLSVDILHFTIRYTFTILKWHTIELQHNVVLKNNTVHRKSIIVHRLRLMITYQFIVHANC